MQPVLAPTRATWEEGTCGTLHSVYPKGNHFVQAAANFISCGVFFLLGDVFQFPLSLRGTHLLPGPGFAFEGGSRWNPAHVHSQGKPINCAIWSEAFRAVKVDSCTRA